MINLSGHICFTRSATTTCDSFTVILIENGIVKNCRSNQKYTLKLEVSTKIAAQKPSIIKHEPINTWV